MSETKTYRITNPAGVITLTPLSANTESLKERSYLDHLRAIVEAAGHDAEPSERSWVSASYSPSGDLLYAIPVCLSEVEFLVRQAESQGWMVERS